jgi:hypothetical protein
MGLIAWLRSLVNRQNTRAAGNWKDVARAAGYTPVFADWCFQYALDVAGQPIVSVDGSWRDGRVVRNPIWRNIILARASALHTELAHVRPVRGAEDPGCQSCKGTGVPLAGYDVICYCGGLGWLPSGAPQASEEKRVADAAARALGFTPVSTDDFCEDYALDAEGNPIKTMWADWRNSERVRDPVERDRILELARVQSLMR